MDTYKNSRELPIDEGWSWVICFASFLCMFMIGTSMQALSVLFLELVNEFGSSVTITSLTVMCFIMSLSVSSVVSTSVIIPAYGERRVVAISGAIFASCSIGYFLAPNIIVFILFAAVKGMCVGMIFVPCLSLISIYFNRRRSLAVTISSGGVCVASIVSPPIIRLITTTYGLRGTFLLLAAIELHMIAGGLLMRPVSSYLPVRKEISGLTTLPDEDESALIKDKTPDTENKTRSEDVADSETKEEILSYSLSHENNLNPTVDSNNHNHVSKNLNHYNSADTHASDALLQRSEITGVLETDKPFLNEKLPSLSDSRKESIPRKRSLGEKSFHGSNTSLSQRRREEAAHHQSMLSITSGLEPGVTGVGLQGEHDDEVKDQGWKSCCCIRIIRRIFDPSLFTQWSYRVFLISCVPSATTQYLLQYIPTIAFIKGASKEESATLLTIVGSVDLISRLAVGFFADTHLLKATQIVAISQICQGILCQFNPLFDTFEKMIAMVVFMGLFIGTRQSLMAMVHIEIVGIEKMSRCLSVSAMLATISAATHSPMLSAIMEATGSYNIVLHYVGISLTVGAVMMLLTPCLSKIDERHKVNHVAIKQNS